MAAFFVQVDITERTPADGFAVSIHEFECEGHGAGEFGREVRDHGRGGHGVTLEEHPPGQIGQQDRVAVEFLEFLFRDALLVIKAVDDAVAVLIAVGVAELQEMETAEQLAAPGGLQIQLPGQFPETM